MTDHTDGYDSVESMLHGVAGDDPEMREFARDFERRKQNRRIHEWVHGEHSLRAVVRCETCKGLKNVNAFGHEILCPACNGTGCIANQGHIAEAVREWLNEGHLREVFGTLPPDIQHALTGQGKHHGSAGCVMLWERRDCLPSKWRVKSLVEYVEAYEAAPADWWDDDRLLGKLMTAYGKAVGPFEVRPPTPTLPDEYYIAPLGEAGVSADNPQHALCAAVLAAIESQDGDER